MNSHSYPQHNDHQREGQPSVVTTTMMMNNIHKYTDELGLTTHRASVQECQRGYSDSLYPASNESRYSITHPYLTSSRFATTIRDTDTKSSSKYTAPSRVQPTSYRQDDEKWWHLPLPARSYEQKLQKVSIAFSLDEIYSKANLEDVQTPRVSSQHASIYCDPPAYDNHERPVQEDNVNPGHKNLIKSSLESLHEDLIEASYRKQRAAATFSSAGQEYLAFRKETNAPSADKSSPPEGQAFKDNWLTQPSISKEELEEINHRYSLPPLDQYQTHYKTFEEARLLYSLSEDSDDDVKTPVLGERSTPNDVDVESRPVKCRAAIDTQITPEENNSETAAVTNTKSSTTEQEMVESKGNGYTTKQEPTDLNMNHIITPIQQVDWDVNASSDRMENLVSTKAPAKSEKTNFAATIEMKPVSSGATPRIKSKSSKPKERHLLTLSLQSSQSITAREASSSEEETPKPKPVQKRIRLKNVPPIDLSLLSPKKTKSKVCDVKDAKPIHKSVDRKAVHTTKQIRPETAKSKTKRIAEEIKRRVNKNIEAPSAAMKTELGANAKVKNWLQSESVASNHSPKSILSSYRGYDKFKEMSPRILIGELSVWQCLPDEIWLKVMSFLVRDNLYAFMRTCKDFCRIAHDKSLWRDVTITKKKLSDDDLGLLAELEPTKLTITQCTGQKLNGDIVSNLGMMSLFSACGEKLTYLNISSCVLPPLSGEALLHHASLHCPGVQYLDVSWCNLSDRDVQLIAESFPKLTALLLSGNQTLTDDSIIPLLTKFTNQLQQLEIAGCFKLTDATLQRISACAVLTALNIGQCHKFTPPVISNSLCQLHQLESLNMKSLKQLRDSCVVSIVNRCTRLKTLNLSQCTAITQKSLLEISCSLTQLKYLDVSSCKNCVNDASISALLANCSGLVSIDLSSTQISNHSVQNLAESCVSLAELKLNFCSVNESGIIHLLERASNMAMLQVYGVRGLQTEQLRASFASVSIQQ